MAQSQQPQGVDPAPTLQYSHKRINGVLHAVGTLEYVVSPDVFGNELFDFDDVASRFMENIGCTIVQHMFGRDAVHYRFLVDLTYSEKGDGGDKIDDVYATQYEDLRHFDSFNTLEGRLDSLTDSVVEYLSSLEDSLYQITKFRVQFKYRL